jgi:trimethylamine--corrinoid protein Co-methyltransferase
MYDSVKRKIKYRVWDKEQCEEVVNSAYRILARTGCKVKHEKAREILKAAGCVIDGENVKIPYGLLQWAVNRAPGAVTLYDRLGNPAMDLSSDKVYFGPTITMTKTVDLKTGKKRLTNRQDAVEAALVIDALPNVAWASGFDAIGDVDTKVTDLYEIYSIVQNTTKPVMYWAQSLENLEFEFKMFEAIAGGADAYRAKPFGINLVCPIDPLVHTNEGMSQIIYMAEKQSPVVYIPGIAFGLSGPITLAGSIAVGLADTLAGLVVSQLVSPGAPFVASKFNDNLNIATTSICHSRPELIIAQNATGDVFRYLGLPWCANYGGTDSGILDPVAGIDKSIQLYNALLAGANMVFSLGAYESGGLSRLEDLVFCNELINFLKALVKGIEISDETLAEDVIDEVGPGQNFLAEEQTVLHYREFWTPDILKPVKFDEAVDGHNAYIESAMKDRVRAILDKGPQKPLPPEVVEKLDGIIAMALSSV